VGREPLLMPQGPRTGIKDNPNDPVHLIAFYVGITTNFWVRACQHTQNGYKRMYVVHRSIHPAQTTGNLKIATMRHFQDRTQIPTMSNKTLINRNTRAGGCISRSISISPSSDFLGSVVKFLARLAESVLASNSQ
jgi:hypothetical protein